MSADEKKRNISNRCPCLNFSESLDVGVSGFALVKTKYDENTTTPPTAKNSPKKKGPTKALRGLKRARPPKLMTPKEIELPIRVNANPLFLPYAC